MDPMNDEVYFGPFRRNQAKEINGVLKNHLDDFRDANLRQNVETSLDPQHWRTKDQIVGHGQPGQGGSGPSAPVGSTR